MKFSSALPAVALVKVVAAQAAYINALPAAPSYVSKTVDRRFCWYRVFVHPLDAFASFSIAIHWFQDYAGNSSNPNTFSRNILSELDCVRPV